MAERYLVQHNAHSADKTNNGYEMTAAEFTKWLRSLKLDDGDAVHIERVDKD